METSLSLGEHFESKPDRLPQSHDLGTFTLSADCLVPWDGDLDAHAKQFAETIAGKRLSVPMAMAALGGTCEMLIAFWVLIEKHPEEEAMRRMTEWRRLVVFWQFCHATRPGRN